jgi:hypothetical protein
MPEFLDAEFLTALGLFVSTVTAAVVSLRREFKKAAVKVEEVRHIVNSQLDVAKTERDDARTELRSYKAERGDLTE